MYYLLLLFFLFSNIHADVCFEIDTQNNCIKDGEPQCEGSVIISSNFPNTICENGFKGNTKITNITLQGLNPLNVKNSAFEGATHLNSVISNAGIASLGQLSFKWCTSLTSIDISNVLIIPKHCFERCTSLQLTTDLCKVIIFEDFAFADSNVQRLTFGKELQKIGDGAFQCTQIVTVTLPSDPQIKFGGGVFSACGLLTTVDVGRTTEIPDYTFSACVNLTTLLNSERVTSFGVHAFLWSSLSSIKFGKHLKFLGKEAFSFTLLKTVELPNSVEVFEDGVFEACGEIESVTVTDNIDIPQMTFSACTKLKRVDGFNKINSFGGFSFANTKLKEITFGDHVKNISKDAFRLLEIVSVTFGNNPIEHFGIGVFEWIASLETVNLGGLTAIPDLTFKGCTSLTKVVNLDKITSFGISCFESVPLTQITFSNDVTRFGNYAFKNVQITSLALPSVQIKDFGNGVFENVITLESLDLGGNIFIPDNTFKNCSNLSHVKGAQNVVSFGNSSFENTIISDVQFSELLENIGDHAFKNTLLSTVILPRLPLNSFGIGTFENNIKLKNVIVGGTTKLPKDTFKNCLELNVVSNLTQVTSFGESCFEKTLITNFEYGNSITEIGDFAFKGTQISVVKLPKIVKIGNAIYENCESLENVDFGKNTIIPHDTFKGCKSLLLLNGTEFVSKIEKGAFTNTKKLESINMYNLLVFLEDPLDSQKNLFFHGSEQPKILPNNPYLNINLKIFVTEKYTNDKFGNNTVTKLNCTKSQFIDVSTDTPSCKNCKNDTATLDGDNYYCDINTTNCFQTLDNCRICINGKCLQCKDEYYLFTPNNICLLECPDGYYNGMIFCEKCKTHYKIPCEDYECERCTNNVLSTFVVMSLLLLLFTI
ncbi:hypothetical protein EIN_063060 [Entamoeba invadens IP1]|uniref:hypothetical protein n=1 Tax=Entamoeba invadens IP1 TaxID=370355 RepID=UPI0002C3F52C|nr:hypothetical protein EIN_063060 [Entamoeba invadens IP1]ELP93591.1 hypothetical protein EIN_063060 [Entamoeba invadens IP1]|eukprot:XP_004260362.1 hypothetical protein EIN_063060 [Entamoeba invadens IP1]